jgi:Domain of unknown function (DUF5103)
MRKTLALIWLGLSWSLAFSQNFEDEKVENENIKTVILYAFGPNQSYSNRNLKAPVIGLKDNNSLFLEFDDLTAQYAQYRVKITHCDANWNNSNLNDFLYLNDFNDFFINTYEVSQNTKVPYYHYRFKLPRVKISGNYILQVFKDEIGGQLAIQKQFQIIEPKIGILAEIITPQDPAIWQTHQQINLSLDLGDYRITNVREELQIKIRQNFRPDRVMNLLATQAIAKGRNTLAFNFFKNENTFSGGNEFRNVDISSSFSKGNSIQKITLGIVDELSLIPQNTRANRAYQDAFDMNGNFVIMNHSNQDPDLSSDYVNVRFRLNLTTLEPNNLPSVVGKFNDWNTLSGQMELNPNTLLYEKTILLKQGIYDYMFSQNLETGLSTTNFEGNHSDSGNTYEIFVYHKSPSSRATQLIGYQQILSKKQN